MGVVVALALSIGGDPGLPLERVLPEPVAVRIRMLSLREGMSGAEVRRRLGLKDRPLTGYCSTVSTSIARFAVGRTHELTLVYSSSGLAPGTLSKATLEAVEAR